MHTHIHRHVHICTIADLVNESDKTDGKPMFLKIGIVSTSYRSSCVMFCSAALGALKVDAAHLLWEAVACSHLHF